MRSVIACAGFAVLAGALLLGPQPAGACEYIQPFSPTLADFEAGDWASEDGVLAQRQQAYERDVGFPEAEFPSVEGVVLWEIVAEVDPPEGHSNASASVFSAVAWWGDGPDEPIYGEEFDLTNCWFSGGAAGQQRWEILTEPDVWWEFDAEFGERSDERLTALFGEPTRSDRDAAVEDRLVDELADRAVDHFGDVGEIQRLGIESDQVISEPAGSRSARTNGWAPIAAGLGLVAVATALATFLWRRRAPGAAT